MTHDADGVPRWKVFGERTLYDNPWIRLVQVDVEPPDGNRFWHHVVRLQVVAAAVVLNGDEEALMLRRHRFATDDVGWELPGGILEPGETGAQAAAREVEEETGWRPTAGLLRSRVTPGHGVDEVVGSAVGASGGSGDVGFAVASVKADGGVS